MTITINNLFRLQVFLVYKIQKNSDIMENFNNNKIHTKDKYNNDSYTSYILVLSLIL